MFLPTFRPVYTFVIYYTSAIILAGAAAIKQQITFFSYRTTYLHDIVYNILYTRNNIYVLYTYTYSVLCIIRLIAAYWNNNNIVRMNIYKYWTPRVTIV